MLRKTVGDIMYKVMILALIVLVFSPLAAELVIGETWNFTDDPLGTNDDESAINSSIELANGDILSVGYKSSFYNAAYVEHPFVMRHTASGETVWGNVYSLSEIQSSRTRAIYAKILSNGSVFIGCTSQGNGYGAFIMSINPNTAQVLSHNLFYSTPVNFLANPSTGTFYTYRNSGSGSSAYIEISQFTATGQPMGSAVTIEAVGMANIVQSLVATPDDGYLLCGARGSDALLVRFNSSMQSLWEQTYSGDGIGTQVLNHVVQTSNGTIFAAGKDDGEGFILYTTYSGNVLWQQVSGSAEYNSVCETADGNLVAAGAFAVPFNPRKYLLLYSTSGDLLYVDSTFDYYGWYKSVNKAGEHGFVASGWRNSHVGTSMSDVNISYFSGYVDNGIIVNQILPFVPTPQNNIIDVMASSAQSFSITASDPDGNQLNYSWLLNGEEVSTSNSYTFQSTLNQAGETFMLFLQINDFARNALMYNWQINVSAYLYPPYPPYPNMPFDGMSGYPVDFNPSLSWNYAWDQNHTQDRSVLYLSTDMQAVANMNPVCKVQDDGTLHESYNFEILPNQTYYWRVVVYNGIQATVSDVWSFGTEAIINTFPYVQNFEGGFLPPSGWFNYNSQTLNSDPMPGMGGGWGNAWDSQYVHSGDGAIMCTPYQMPQYYWLISPFFNIRSSSQLRFWLHYQSSIDNPTEVHVMIKTIQGWQLLQSFNSPAQSNAYASEINIPLDAYYGQNARLAFVYNCHSQANIVAIDDLSIHAEGDLPQPTNLHIARVNGQIQLSWDSSNESDLFRVYQASTPNGTWTLVSGANGFSRIGNRVYWNAVPQDRFFYRVTRYTP